MSKKLNLMKKGFNNLVQSTNINEDSHSTNENLVKRLDAQTSNHLNAEFKSKNVAKYKELKKCTLYLPSDIMDSLAIMKIKTKKDLSVLAAEALSQYLQNNNINING